MRKPDSLNDIRRELAGRNDVLPAIFSALADESRFRMFTLISRRPGLCVTDFAAVLGVSVSAASQQLKILEFAGIVRRERLGQKCSYSVRRDDPVIRAIMKLNGKGRR
jgi:DNA-binding transcriptional ArsR family regulator